MGNKQTIEKLKSQPIYDNVFELYNAGYLIDFKDYILKHGDDTTRIRLDIAYSATECNGKLYKGNRNVYDLYNTDCFENRRCGLYIGKMISKLKLKYMLDLIPDNAVISVELLYHKKYELVGHTFVNKKAQTKADLTSFIYRNFVLSPLPAYEDIKPSAPPAYSGEPDVPETTKD
jgi:hypothetical protein